jgi:hypothetical protein
MNVGGSPTLDTKKSMVMLGTAIFLTFLSSILNTASWTARRDDIVVNPVDALEIAGILSSTAPTLLDTAYGYAAALLIPIMLAFKALYTYGFGSNPYTFPLLSIDEASSV